MFWRRKPKPNIDRIDYGLDPSGGAVAVNAQLHTYVLGCTGSGKGSISNVWIRSQAPYIRQGLVRLSYIDLKYGVEASMLPDDLVFRKAWNMDEVNDLLSGLQRELIERAEAIRGASRDISRPSEQYPRELLVIDEAAELATAPTRELKKKSDEALGRLDEFLRTSRALGGVCLALSQDPRLASFPLRHRFPQRMALRLDSEAEARMALGDHAVDMGADPQDIPTSRPGTAWFVNTENNIIQRFRAPFVSDEELRGL